MGRSNEVRQFRDLLNCNVLYSILCIKDFV